MNLLPLRMLAGAVSVSVLALVGCDSSTDDTTSDDSIVTDTTTINEGIDLSLFVQGAFAEEPEIVDCETASGTQTQCYKMVTTGHIAGREPGSFCPRTIFEEDVDNVGGWFSKEGTGDLVDITGAFIQDLAGYYEDSNWKLYEDDGSVRYTSTVESCAGAAVPEVEEQFQQNCIECQLSYLEEDFELTYLIPVTPIPLVTEGSLSPARSAGIALDGAELAGPAPADAILSQYTIAAFDDCGGHINLHQGYHYHSTTGCSDNLNSTDGHAALVGYAQDGYGIYAMRDAEGNEEFDLDECRGQTDETRGYHYHAASPSENLIIGCNHGEVAVNPDAEQGPPEDDAPTG